MRRNTVAAPKSGYIPKAFIDELSAKADIVATIGQYVELTKKGKDFWGCCPFHGEKTASFSVSSSKGFYKCFGCGVKGGAITFLMEHNKVNFVEAVHELADFMDVEVPYEELSEEEKHRQDLYDILQKATKYYEGILREEAGKKGIEYLKQRKLTGETAKHYRLGYATDAWDGLIKAIGTDKKSLELMVEAGLIIPRSSGNGYFDRFRSRVMFPIRDARGNVSGFTGRTVANEDPKYMNSPETPVFKKAEELYGLYEANLKPRRAVFVEGQVDVTSLTQAGVEGAIASSGTSVTPKHIEKIYRSVDEIIFCMDGDKAGRAAAWRLVEHLMPTIRDGRIAKFVFLPEGEDPDSLVNKIGGENFNQMLAQESVPLSEYILNRLEGDVKVASIEERARLAAQAQQVIDLCHDQIYRELLVQAVRERIGLPLTIGLGVEHDNALTKKTVHAPVQETPDFGFDDLQI